MMLSVLNNPVLTLQLGILGKLLGLMGRIVKGCVREVSLAQVSCILMYVYVAPPTPVGTWSMALGLRQRFEYYYYIISDVIGITVPYLAALMIIHYTTAFVFADLPSPSGYPPSIYTCILYSPALSAILDCFNSSASLGKLTVGCFSAS